MYSAMWIQVVSTCIPLYTLGVNAALQSLEPVGRLQRFGTAMWPATMNVQRDNLRDDCNNSWSVGRVKVHD